MLCYRKQKRSIISEVEQFNCPVIGKQVFFLMNYFKAAPFSPSLAVPPDRVRLLH